jgi:hypothetical protein
MPETTGDREFRRVPSGACDIRSGKGIALVYLFEAIFHMDVVKGIDLFSRIAKRCALHPQSKE